MEKTEFRKKFWQQETEDAIRRISMPVFLIITGKTENSQGMCWKYSVLKM